MPKVHATAEAGVGRLGRSRRVATSLSEINVVPLVDVMLVLLIIFMVTAPLIQRGIDVNLPVAQRAAVIVGERLSVTVPLTYRQNHVLFLGTESLRIEALQERIRQKLEGGSEKKVYLRGDGRVEFQDVMDVFDRLKAAGVESIGIETKMPGDR